MIQTIPAHIENALVSLWESMKTTSKVRSCLFNLVFYVQDPSRMEYYKGIVVKLIQTLPSRIVFIVEKKEGDPNKLDTFVSVISPEGQENISCDYIYVEAHPAVINRIPSLVLPHLIPDLPVYLIWTEDPNAPNSARLGLEKVATRIIFDSESCEDFILFAKELITQYEKEHFEIADLNWARIQSWRELIAKAFAQKEQQSMLPNLSSIKITYNAHETLYFKKSRIQAFYLAAWIASSLNLQFSGYQEEGDKVIISYGTKTFELIPGTSETLRTGAVLSVDFIGNDHRRYLFGRNPKRPEDVLMHFSSETECYLPIHFLFTKTESGQSLVKEIYHKETSLHFIRVLNHLLVFNQPLHC